MSVLFAPPSVQLGLAHYHTKMEMLEQHCAPLTDSSLTYRLRWKVFFCCFRVCIDLDLIFGVRGWHLGTLWFLLLFLLFVAFPCPQLPASHPGE